jgi:hypothetical protein
MSTTTLDRSGSRTPEQRAHDRFAARRAMAAANADVSVCENQALSNAASEALATRRRLRAGVEASKQ